MDPIDERLNRAGAAWRNAQPPTEMPLVVERLATPRRMQPRLVPVMGLLAMVIAAVGMLWAVSPRGVLEVAGSPAPRPVALLTESAPATSCVFVRIAGVLARDEQSGLGIVGMDGAAMPVRWPYGFSAYEQAGRVVLLDDTQAPLAFDGDLVAFGSAGTSLGIRTACRVSLDAQRPVPGTPLTGNLGRPFTAAELLALVRLGASGTVVPEVIVAEVSIDRAEEDGTAASQSPFGLVDANGDRMPIIVDPALAASLHPVTALTGTFAFAIQDEGLRLVGPVEPADGGGFLHHVVDLALMHVYEPGPDSLVVADGWLTFSPLWCPVGVTQTAGVGAPSGGCRAVRIADAPDNPTLVIPVQDAAWREFGEVPGLDVDLPRHGVYLLRRGADGPDHDWVVIARLEPAGSTSMALPTLATWTGACRGVGLDARLTGDPSDPRVTWLVDQHGVRQDIVWPPGTTARFAPALEVIDGQGTVMLREGDHVNGGCTTGPDADGPKLIAPGR